MQTEPQNKLTNQSSSHIQYSLRDFLNVLFQHQSKITIFFLAVFTTVCIGTYFEDDIYKSSAKLLIRAGRQSVSIDPSGAGRIDVAQNLIEEVNSEVDILNSQYLAGQVVDKIGPEVFLALAPPPPTPTSSPDEDSSGIMSQLRAWKASLRTVLINFGLSSEPPPARDIAITKFLKNLSVVAEEESHIISVFYESTNAKFAQHVLDILINLYLDRHIEVHQSQASLNFFKKQSQFLRDKVINAEKQLDEFREKNGITLMEEQISTLVSQITHLQSLLDETNSNVNSSNARIVSFEDTLKAYPSTMVLNSIAGKTNVSADGIKRRIIDLRVQERDLAMRFQQNARPLQDVREQILLLEKELAKEETTLTEVTTGIDTNYQALMFEMNKEQSNFRGLIAQSEILAKELKNRKIELLQLINLEHEYVRLQKEVDIAKEGYYQYRENLQRAEIYTALDVNKISSVRVVQPAFVSTKPIWPNRFLMIFLGLFLGFFGSISLGFILNYLDDSLKTDLDVKNKLGLPVLAMISDNDYQKCI